MRTILLYILNIADSFSGQLQLYVELFYYFHKTPREEHLPFGDSRTLLRFTVNGLKCFTAFENLTNAIIYGKPCAP